MLIHCAVVYHSIYRSNNTSISRALKNTGMVPHTDLLKIRMFEEVLKGEEETTPPGEATACPCVSVTVNACILVFFFPPKCGNSNMGNYKWRDLFSTDLLMFNPI